MQQVKTSVIHIKDTLRTRLKKNKLQNETRQFIKKFERMKKARRAKQSHSTAFMIRTTLVILMATTWPETLQRGQPGQLPWLKGQEPTLKAYDCSKTTDNRNIEYFKEKSCIDEDKLYIKQRNISAMIIQDTIEIYQQFDANCGKQHHTPIAGCSAT